jgi:hypothetical protein
MENIYNIKEKLPEVEYGIFLVYTEKIHIKNSHWLIAEYYNDVKAFYIESSENMLKDVNYWAELPEIPKE